MNLLGFLGMLLIDLVSQMILQSFLSVEFTWHISSYLELKNLTQHPNPYDVCLRDETVS